MTEPWEGMVAAAVGSAVGLLGSLGVLAGADALHHRLTAGPDPHPLTVEVETRLHRERLRSLAEAAAEEPYRGLIDCEVHPDWSTTCEATP